MVYPLTTRSQYPQCLLVSHTVFSCLIAWGCLCFLKAKIVATVLRFPTIVDGIIGWCGWRLLCILDLIALSSHSRNFRLKGNVVNGDYIWHFMQVVYFSLFMWNFSFAIFVVHRKVGSNSSPIPGFNYPMEGGLPHPTPRRPYSM